MGTGYLMDTNIAIYFLNAQLPEKGRIRVLQILNEGYVYISFISKIEILGWPFKSDMDEQNARSFVDALKLIAADNEIIDKTIELRKQGPKRKLPDAMIAATALVNELTLITRNVSDFTVVPGLLLEDPFMSYLFPQQHIPPDVLPGTAHPEAINTRG